MSRNHDDLNESILLVARELCGIRGQIEQHNKTNSILERLEEMEKRIMATQAEQAAQITADLKASNAQLKKLINDTRGLQPAVDELKAKIAELEELILAGGAITPEMVELSAEAKTLTNTVDDNVPELPAPPV